MNRFNEKEEEYSTKSKTNIPVWQSPKYLESKKKAIAMIDNGKYDLQDEDFWILMNETKSGKMAYTGLIISHNGCLKINDKLDVSKRFKPECLKRELVRMNSQDNLIYEYCDSEQGLFEVGEVNDMNCKNDYAFAMALKRCFDRVVLKNSKLAYSGICSDSEADEFGALNNIDTSRKPTDIVKQKLIEEAKSYDVNFEKLAEYLQKDVEDLTTKDLQYAIEEKKSKSKLAQGSSFKGE